MDRLIAYVQRAERGAWIRDAFLAGGQSVDRWAPESGENETPTAVGRARAAGEWIADRLVARGIRSRRLDRLILDTDGGVFGWVDAPSAELGVVRAAAAQLDAPPWPVDDAEEGGVTIQPLDRARRNGTSESTPARRPILHAPDAGLRVLIDELDHRRVTLGVVESIWHTLCKAWDPASPDASSDGGSTASDRLVGESGVSTGVVLADPVAGRLIWAWSRNGELVCGGRLLLPRRADAGDEEGSIRRVGGRAEGVRIGEAEVSRLASDWLGWSVQVGLCPSRIICILPPISGEHIDELADAGAVGRRLGELWPRASVEVLVEEDPLRETLLRAGESREDRIAASGNPARSLIALSRRPGRAHRALYTWTAVALFALAATLIVLGVGWRSRASDRTERRIELATRFRDEAAEVLPRERLQRPVLELRRMIDSLKQQASAGSGIDPAPPILDEFGAIMDALVSIEVPFERIKLVDVDGLPANEVVVLVPRDDPVRYGSRVMRALDRAPGSSLTAWQVDYAGRSRGESEEIRLRAMWARGDEGRAGG